jgi:hypothetical protein
LQEPKLFSSRPLSQILLAKQFVAFEKNDKFLDLGPGNGHGLHVAKHFLHHPELYCVELNTGASDAYERLYDAKSFTYLMDIPRFTKGKKFKLCLMSHVLEHYKTSEVCPLLKTLKSLLDDDGILVAEVPNVDLRIHSSFRFEDSPHLLFFSQESLGLLFEKNNWEVLFLNTVAEKYEDWWEHKKKLVNGISFTPRRKEVFSRDKRITDCIDQQFAYGGNRTCLRIVAKPTRAK